MPDDTKHQDRLEQKSRPGWSRLGLAEQGGRGRGGRSCVRARSAICGDSVTNRLRWSCVSGAVQYLVPHTWMGNWQ